MTIDLFSFNPEVNPLAVYKVTQFKNYIYDLSNEKEFKPICAVDCFNDDITSLNIKYITENIIMPGVDINFDPTFLCGCDCTNNCEDKANVHAGNVPIQAKKIPKVVILVIVTNDYMHLCLQEYMSVIQIVVA